MSQIFILSHNVQEFKTTNKRHMSSFSIATAQVFCQYIKSTSLFNKQWEQNTLY